MHLACRVRRCLRYGQECPAPGCLGCLESPSGRRRRCHGRGELQTSIPRKRFGSMRNPEETLGESKSISCSRRTALSRQPLSTLTFASFIAMRTSARVTRATVIGCESRFIQDTGPRPCICSSDVEGAATSPRARLRSCSWGARRFPEPPTRSQLSLGAGAGRGC